MTCTDSSTDWVWNLPKTPTMMRMPPDRVPYGILRAGSPGGLPMVVLILEKVPRSLRGELTRWMIEVDTGIFVGRLSAMVRDLL